jgi:hypothetical protein
LSRRHREWGIDCPAVDVDLLLVEFDHGRPSALIEYKHWRAALLERDHPSYKAIRALADGSRIPFIAARYWPEHWTFEGQSMNSAGERLLPRRQRFDEIGWVRFLYRLRGREMPVELTAQLRSAA